MRSAAPAQVTFDLELAGSVGTHTASAVGHLASTVVDTTAATDDLVPAQAPVTVAAKHAQTITFPQLPETAVDQPAPTPAATATSSLPVAYSGGTAGVCTVSGSTLTLTGAGTCSVTAQQPGDATWAAAAPVTRTFTVLAQRHAQTITFPALPDAVVGRPAPALQAQAESGLPVTYAAGPARSARSRRLARGADRGHVHRHG